MNGRTAKRLRREARMRTVGLPSVQYKRTQVSRTSQLLCVVYACERGVYLEMKKAERRVA